MAERGESTGHQAFKRLLSDGSAGGQAKIDALVALAQRTLFLTTWTPGGDGYRTITNSNGQTALPVFTDPGELERGAEQLGWVGPDGTTPHHEVGAREALRHAVAHNLDFVVVDIGSEHSLDIDQEEITPLLSPEARRDSSGPYAAVGPVTNSMMRVVKATPPPGTLKSPKVPAPVVSAASSYPPPSTQKLSEHPPPGVTAVVTDDPDKIAEAAATFGGGSSVTIRALGAEPPDSLLSGLAAMLRGYPEVEWAALADVARGPSDAVPTVTLRIDTSFRQRVNEIISAVQKTGGEHGALLDVLLLDDQKLIRDARSSALIFFPWRRK